LTQVRFSDSGSTPAAAWPLQSQLELAALPGAVPCARMHTRLVLWEWDQAAQGETAELIVSELMTNALRASMPGALGWPGPAGPGGQQVIGIRLASDRQHVLVEVWDGNPAPPVPGMIHQDGETGRGLLMVQQVSHAWGYYYPDRQPGITPPAERAVKVVWALVAPRPRR
jgi:hypothetical protein